MLRSRSDNTTPFIQLNTEGDLEELAASYVRQSDTNYLRTWELAGASHIDEHEAVWEAEDAALADMRRWLTQGVAPPHGNQILTNPFWFNTIFRDQYGNALGGVRLPDIQAPTETYSAINVVEPETTTTTVAAAEKSSIP